MCLADDVRRKSGPAVLLLACIARASGGGKFPRFILGADEDCTSSCSSFQRLNFSGSVPVLVLRHSAVPD